MDLKMFITKRAAVWQVLGLIRGGLAADGWEHQRSARDLAEIKVQ